MQAEADSEKRYLNSRRTRAGRHSNRVEINTDELYVHCAKLLHKTIDEKGVFDLQARHRHNRSHKSSSKGKCDLLVGQSFPVR